VEDVQDPWIAGHAQGDSTTIQPPHPPDQQPAFEPGRLRLARELNEWSQADLARQIGVSPAAVSQFEAGNTRPSAETVDRIAAALEVPTAFLGLPEPEVHEGFFRSLRRTSVGHRRRARAIAHVAHDIARDGGAGFLSPVALPSERPIALDAPIREVEKAAEQARLEFEIPPGPVDSVVELLEQKGIVLIRLPLDTADVDAFSLPFHDRPVIVLGSDKNDRARSRFDAAHELGHLVVHGDRVWGVQEVEQQAHAFAAALLMPADDIRDELPERADWETLFALKEKWQVSLAALLMRARKLGRMSESHYISAVKVASARGWRRIEPVPLGPPEKPTCLAALMNTEPGIKAAQSQPPRIVDALLAAIAV